MNEKKERKKEMRKQTRMWQKIMKAEKKKKNASN